MPIRRLPDGTVVADTPQELAAYDRAVAATPKAEPKPRRARRAPKANGRASAQEPDPRRRRGRAGEWSVQPLAEIENIFAVDSTGFSTCNYERWFDVKYGRDMSKRGGCLRAGVL